MRWKSFKFNFSILLLIFSLLIFVIQCEIAAAYKSEIEITPAPIEEPTTKKSGFFSGFKNFFRGAPSTTTTVDPLSLSIPTPKTTTIGHNTPTTAQKPSPLVITHAPLMPIGPRPDTPSSSPFGGNNLNVPPQWPQQTNGVSLGSTTTLTPQPNQPKQTNLPSNTNTNTNNFGSNSGFGGIGQPAARPTPNLPPGFQPYRPRQQPSGLDLSYGAGNFGTAAGSNIPARPVPTGHPTGHGHGLAPMASPTLATTTTTTTTTVKPQHPVQPVQPAFGGFSLPQQTKDDYPALPSPRRPSSGGIKEDFPVLPTPKSPVPTPSSPLRPSSPSAWNSPLPTPATPAHLPAHPVRPGSPSSPAAGHMTGGSGVSFVPHASGSGGTTSEGGGNSLATDDELRTFTENLFTKEVNSQLNLIQVNVQGKTRSIDSADEAPQPLLQIDEKAFNTPTIAKMRLLFNNYETDTLVNEHVTPNEHKEENDFLDAVMATAVMRQAMLFLQNKGIVTPDPKTHRDLVKELWFTQYSRGAGKIGSSGFEHVFVNEVKNGTIIGLHNWVYFYDEEHAGRLDYKGYMNQLDLGTKGKILKARFTHNNLNKPVNTLFIGTSPELELALYTVCFKIRPDRTCPVSLDNKKFGIVTYSWRYRGKNLIGSAYPEI